MNSTCPVFCSTGVLGVALPGEDISDAGADIAGEACAPGAGEAEGETGVGVAVLVLVVVVLVIVVDGAESWPSMTKSAASVSWLPGQLHCAFSSNTTSRLMCTRRDTGS
jgi:hypothetical protein